VTEQRMLYFAMLDQDEQRAAIRRLAASGFSDYGVSAATGLAVEQVRAIIGEKKAEAAAST
jgi:hypothetical protein